MKTDQNTELKTDPLAAHAKAWRAIFEDLADSRLKDFAKEPLDKKTTIVCTAYIVEAIRDAALYLGDILKDERHYPHQLSEPEVCPYADPPRPWIYEILTEVCSGIDVQVIDAHCNAFNFASAERLVRCLIAEGSPKAANVLERELQRIAKHPLPQVEPSESTESGIS
jgi:hypothetical protein